MRRRALPWNRLSSATLVWQCRGPMAQAVVLERETSWPCCSATEIYVTRLRRGNDQFMRRADGAVETRQPAVAQPAGCRVSIKHGATWGSRGELHCPLERALPRAHVLSDHVHRASCGACVPQQQPAPDLPMAQHVSWLTGRIICRVTTAAGIDGSFDRGEHGAIDSRGLRRAIWRRWRLHVPIAAICRRGLMHW